VRVDHDRIGNKIISFAHISIEKLNHIQLENIKILLRTRGISIVLSKP